MSKSKDLLIEIGTEELPPKSLKKLSEAFKDGVHEGLNKADLDFAETKVFATPRRLGLLINSVQIAQADKIVQRRGPAVKAAYDKEGKPSKAAEGFAKSCGVDFVDLQTLKTDKGEWLVYDSEQKGQSAQELLPAIINQSLDKLPIPKRMRWGDLNDQFVRPVHWAVVLLGSDAIECNILSVTSGNKSRGHRFYFPKDIAISGPSKYESLLNSKGKVIASFEERRKTIRQQVEAVAKGAGGKAVIDADLLDEVTSMVEWPTAVLGNFESKFLEVPQEALITTMKSNQKYFYLVDNNNKLLPHFITIANIDSTNPDAVRKGNERVIRPRLKDAEFFWNQDRKQALADHIESTKAVVFQKQLGSVYDKTQRVSQLISHIAKIINCDVTLCQRAAELSKCDLMTEMVGEFPSLQGIMGRYYAENDKENNEVALALDEQYMPRYAGDSVPTNSVGQALAIAEKLDTIVGIFAIGQVPTGDKDPFALRRAALGILRTIIENKLEIDLLAAIQSSIKTFESKAVIKDSESLVESVYDFMMQRLRVYYTDSNVSVDVYEAVRSLNPEQPYDFDRRVRAVESFKRLPEAESLAAANKRTANILRKENATIGAVQSNLLSDKAEQDLAEALSSIEKELEPLFAARDYQKALTRLADLKDPVDKFFDDVMVNVDDPAVRQNRLSLLGNLRKLFLRVADLSTLQQ